MADQMLDVLPFAAMALAEEEGSRKAASAYERVEPPAEYVSYRRGKPAPVRDAYARILALLLAAGEEGEKGDATRESVFGIAEAGDYVTLLNFLRTSPTPLSFDAYTLLQGKRREQKLLRGGKTIGGAAMAQLAAEEEKRRRAEGTTAPAALLTNEEFGLFLYFAALLGKPIEDQTPRFAAQFAKAMEVQAKYKV